MIYRYVVAMLSPTRLSSCYYDVRMDLCKYTTKYDIRPMRPTRVRIVSMTNYRAMLAFDLYSNFQDTFFYITAILLRDFLL